MSQKPPIEPITIFETWTEWFTFIPVMFSFVFSVMCAISSIVGFVIFIGTTGVSGVTASLIALSATLASATLVYFVAHRLAFRFSRSSTLKFICTTSAGVFAIVAFSCGVMLSLYSPASSKALFFGMTVSSSPAFLAGWLAVGFVVLFWLEVDLILRQHRKSEFLAHKSPTTAAIIDLNERRRTV